MIYYLQGKVNIKENDFIVVDVSGVGYKVFVSKEINNSLNGNIRIYCYTQKTDKETRLYGFKEKENLELFEKLIKITGIGPKTALDIASTVSMQELMHGIERNDERVMKKVFSIGKKKGQQVVLELSGKIASENKKDEAFATLKALGFADDEIRHTLNKCSSNNSKNRVEEALKLLGKND